MSEEAPQQAPKRGRGRPAWEPSEKERAVAMALFGLGATYAQVARHLKIGLSTAQAHLSAEFQEGYDLANLKLYGALWEKAVVKRDTACLIFLAKNRLGMMDRPSLFPGGGSLDLPPAREELCIEVRYRYSNENGALPPPSPERLRSARPLAD